MSLSHPASLTPALGCLVLLALAASPSSASPAPRGQAETRAAKRSPPPRRELRLSAATKQRINRATTARKPLRYQPFSKKEVRGAVPKAERPARAPSTGKKPKRLSASALTDELNAIEKRLNSQGYSLRDSGEVVFHEHRPDRAKLSAQDRTIGRVAATKPKRAPLSRDKLRAKVRGEARPPRARPARLDTATNGFVLGGAEHGAQSSFGWTPTVGEPEIGSAFLDARASFHGQLGGFDPGLHGEVTVQAGGYVLGGRVELARLEASMDVPPDGTYRAKAVAILPGGFEYPIYDKQGTQPIEVKEALDLFDFPRKLHTKVFIAGYPIDIDVILNPTIKVDADAQLTENYVMGTLAPELRVDTTIEAYVDIFLLEAGAGGSAVLVHATPEVSGAAWYGGTEAQPTVETMLSGRVRFRLLQGEIYAFVDVGIWPLEKRFKWELWDYDGWSYDWPLFEWDRSFDL